MPIKRLSGVLLHPTSLPGLHGSGDLGLSARHFIDWLVSGSQSLWQVLPLGGIGPGNSPYMSPSAFAGNELLIDLVQLRNAGWLTSTDTDPDPAFREDRVNYPTIQRYRMIRLRLAAERFFDDASGEARKAYAGFCNEASEWLDDYALFMALDKTHGGYGKVWQDWPAPLAQRKPKALREAAATLAQECNFWKFCQWCFHSQWAEVKKYANSRGVQIIGDMPIFVSAHSADVWAHQKLFDLDDKGHPRVVAGVPPDYFSANGQRWGNPLYLWIAHEKEDYRWWIARMRAALSLCDIVRIDHFRGFESFWEIPANSETAIYGKWQQGPGVAFFEAMRETVHGSGISEKIPRIIAEDLGIITHEVTALRKAVGLPGMRILQFAFDGKSDNLYLPHNFEANTVVYTGTHDNDTSAGWWASLTMHQQDYVRRYLSISGESIHWDMIRAASASVAAICIIPMQDVLGLDSNHRMNQPGLSEGYWEWRFNWNQVDSSHAAQLAELALLHGRRADSPLPVS